MFMRVVLAASLVAISIFNADIPAQGCPGCGPPTGQTLTSEVAQADFILYGTLTNRTEDPKNPGTAKGTTDLEIEVVIKPHALVKDKKVFTMPRHVPKDAKPTKYMVFFNVIDGDVDPYRGVAVGPDSKLPEYLKGALDVKQKDIVTRLRYFFDHLESNDLEISGDAYNEFAYAEYKEVVELAPKLNPATLLKWLKDPNTRSSRYGLYGMLLGHCGKAEDAKELRALLDDSNHKLSSGLDGMLMGYILLDKKAGYEFLMELIGDSSHDFAIRYAGIKALRFFWDYRPEVLTREQRIDAIKVLLSQSSLADIPIDDLRKWKAWDMTDEVLKYANVQSHNELPIIRRAILKYAMAASWTDPKNTAAATFVAEVRKKDPERVKLIEELLHDELKAIPKTETPKK